MINNDTSGTAKKKAIKLFSRVLDSIHSREIAIIALAIIIFILVALFVWIFHKLGLKEESCNKLNTFYGSSSNVSYFNNDRTIVSDARTNFDNSYNILINYYVKSSYNSCCGDGYKNNFVSLCALEKCIYNGCRFLDFEIYSYNNVPIVASSTANNNFIKETYNALLLSEVLETITKDAFAIIDTNTLKGTNCHNDPLILNFRVMSSNISMFEKMSDLFTQHLSTSQNPNFSLSTSKDNALLNIRMTDLFKKIIIICHFNPDPYILEKHSSDSLQKLKQYINLIGGRGYCNILRYDDIVLKNDNTQTIEDTKKKFIIVLPNLDNSVKNFDSVSSFTNGCQAICMKHQSNPNTDSNLKFYNDKFAPNSYSWILKETHLINVAPPSLDTSEGISLGIT